MPHLEPAVNAEAPGFSGLPARCRTTTEPPKVPSLSQLPGRRERTCTPMPPPPNTAGIAVRGALTAPTGLWEQNVSTITSRTPAPQPSPGPPMFQLKFFGPCCPSPETVTIVSLREPLRWLMKARWRILHGTFQQNMPKCTVQNAPSRLQTPPRPPTRRAPPARPRRRSTSPRPTPRRSAGTRRGPSAGSAGWP